jgi:hypothetical protein
MSEGTSNPRDLSAYERYILRELVQIHAENDDDLRRPWVKEFVSDHFTNLGPRSDAHAAIGALHRDGYLSLIKGGRRMFLTDDQFHKAVTQLGLGHLTMPEQPVPTKSPGLATGGFVRVNNVLDPGDDLPVNRQPGDCRPGELGRLEMLIGGSSKWTYWLVDHGNNYKAIYSDAELTAETPPVPSNLAVSLNEAGKPTLTWDGVSVACKYRVERRYLFGGEVPYWSSWQSLALTKTRSYTDDRASPAVNYEYRVATVMVVGWVASTPIGIRINPPPPQPAAPINLPPQSVLNEQLATTGLKYLALKLQPGSVGQPAQPSQPPSQERRRVVDI